MSKGNFKSNWPKLVSKRKPQQKSHPAGWLLLCDGQSLASLKSPFRLKELDLDFGIPAEVRSQRVCSRRPESLISTKITSLATQ